jgi:putative hydrolase of the HAD superfamily
VAGPVTAAGTGGRPLGLLLDYGGVLTVPVAAAHAAWCHRAGLDPGVLDDVLRRWQAVSQRGREPVSLVERGQLSPAEFERELAARLSEAAGRPVAHAGLLGRILAAFAPDDAMVGVARQIRRTHTRVGLVTNSWGSGTPWERYHGLFDAKVVSYQVGVRKPELAIYLLAAARLGVPPGRCVFVDDLPRNIEGARQAGMLGVCHRDRPATRRALAALFGLSAPGSP